MIKWFKRLFKESYIRTPSHVPLEDKYKSEHNIRMQELEDYRIDSAIREEAYDLYRQWQEQIQRGNLRPVVFNTGFKVGCILEYWPYAKSRHTSKSIQNQRWEQFKKYKEEYGELTGH